jgi:hypothetical protein
MNYRQVLTALLLFGSAEASTAQSIAQVDCSANEHLVSIKYIPGSYEGQSLAPEFPRVCKLGKHVYNIEALQLSLPPLGMCGAMPPASLRITRNNTPLLVDTVFGDTCLGGPSLRELRIVEGREGIGAVHVCTDSGAPKYERFCRNLTSAELRHVRSEGSYLERAIERAR